MCVSSCSRPQDVPPLSYEYYICVYVCVRMLHATIYVSSCSRPKDAIRVLQIRFVYVCVLMHQNYCVCVLMRYTTIRVRMH